MISEAEITEKTGIIYRREETDPYAGTVFGTVNLLEPAFSFAGTGEDTRSKPHVHAQLPQNVVPYQLLSITTGSELQDVSAALLAILFATVSDSATTDYHAVFEIKSSLPEHTSGNPIEQAAITGGNTAVVQAEYLREISGLKVERLAEIFGVSRTTYHKWTAGSQIRDEHFEHLLEVLPLVEEANRRLGGSVATRNWRLTPVSPGGKKPVDYLATREYTTFRGFLLRTRTGEEVFRPLAPTGRVRVEQSREEFEDALERLRPRAWINEEGRNPDIPAANHEEA